VDRVLLAYAMAIRISPADWHARDYQKKIRYFSSELEAAWIPDESAI
jgi:hypothetical protein